MKFETWSKCHCACNTLVCTYTIQFNCGGDWLCYNYLCWNRASRGCGKRAVWSIHPVKSPVDLRKQNTLPEFDLRGGIWYQSQGLLAMWMKTLLHSPLSLSLGFTWVPKSLLGPQQSSGESISGSSIHGWKQFTFARFQLQKHAIVYLISLQNVPQ